MQKSKITAVDIDRPLIVLNPIPGVKYYKLPDYPVYIDIEKGLLLIKKHGMAYFKKQFKNHYKFIKKLVSMFKVV